MQLLLQSLTYHRGSDEPLSMLVIVVVRATLVILAAWLVAATLRRTSAAVQHRVWQLALAGTLVVPALWALTPGWRMPLLTLHVFGPMPQAMTTPFTPHDTWPELLAIVWLIGFAAGLGYLVLGVVAARRLLAGSRGTDNADWLELLHEAKRAVGLQVPVELRFTDRNVSPAVWSLWRVQVLLPEQCRAWPREQRRSVLVHELAHAARRDCLTQLGAGLVCAVWWFHPLVWMAARRMRTYAEQAADDCVIRHGTRRSEYAEQLLAVAGSLGRFRLPALAQGMLKRSYLERRLRAVLDPARRRHPLDQRGAVAGLLTACALAIVLATATPTAVRLDARAPAERVPQRLDLQLELRGVPSPAPREQAPRVPAGSLAVEAERARLARLLVQYENVPYENHVQSGPPVLGQQPALDVEIVPPAIQLLPNWQVGRRADQLIPNWTVGQHAEMLIEPQRERLPSVLVAGAGPAPPAAGAAVPAVKMDVTTTSVE